ncbi:leucine-rich repeat domain-containing protein [Oligoflexus tunisiensis]|uniref:leucine-rich repeat domain-containing protein n=1 Tax=Oligoflexus tunisiensis TaxID=708132 RepID=UPI00114C8961|nr:leucine-rich repeat domain-containing protein [Oligoflexus tunisiensis]
MVLKRLPHAFVLVSLLINCSKKDSDKDKDTNPTTSEGQVCQGLAEGASASLTWYRKERAAWNETCASLALQVNGTCTNGQLLVQEEAFPACEETLLQKLTIKAETMTVNVNGAPLLLTLEGVDQNGQAFVIDNNEATWTSSSDQVTVSADGHVTALGSATDVMIKAVVKDVAAEIKITATAATPDAGRSCEGDTPHGATKEFPRFKAALVNFQSVCESYQATAHCADGQFIFKPEDSITECRVAAVKAFTVNPQALAIKAGESRPVTAEAVDETEYKGALTFQDVTWTIEAGSDDQGKITVADGAIALSADLVEDAVVKAQFRDFTQTITLARTVVEPTRIAFENESHVLKNGDTLTLQVLGFAGDKPVDVDPAKLVLESSDPQKVAIENNAAKVLNAGGSVTITAKYAGETLSAQTRLDIEDELKFVTIASKDDVLIAEKPWVVAAVQLKLEGPALEAPRVESQHSTCVFRPYLSREQWLVDVELKPASDQEIPAACQAEVSVASAAGQKAVHALNVPVRFVALDYREHRLQDASRPDNVIASLKYRLSSNVKLSGVAVAAHQVAELTPAACKLSARESAGLIEVLADISAAPETKFCAGFLTFVVDTNGQKQTIREQVTIAPYRPFREICEDRNNTAAQKTIDAMSVALSIRNDCAMLDSLLREKNSASIFRNRGFTLSMASENLTDLEPVARLTGLRELILTDNPELTDLSPLAWLKTLERLDVDFTRVTDFSPLYKLDAMKHFYADAESIDCKKSEVTNKPLANLCTQE